MIATAQAWQTRLARIDAQAAALKAVGITFFVCGAIGMILPLVPTTELWMVAAYCFAKSAPELAERMFAYPHIGAELRDWVEHGVISRKVKLFAMIGLSANFTSVVWMADLSGAALAIWAGVLLAIAGYVGTRRERS
ncbi:MAG: YbaN family protein [Betaproteobacteria bacterium]|nr:YbaN family protein [Betaproteobacteria bacterium]